MVTGAQTVSLRPKHSFLRRPQLQAQSVSDLSPAALATFSGFPSSAELVQGGPKLKGSEKSARTGLPKWYCVHESPRGLYQTLCPGSLTQDFWRCGPRIMI